MSLNWINPNDYVFNALLLMEHFQIRLMFGTCGWMKNKSEWISNMGIALNANPAVKWYLARRCPECASVIGEIAANGPAVAEAERIRAAEVFILGSVEDFTVHTTPEVMAVKCDYIRGWRKERLYELVDLSGKTVLDVGAGSGRLTFAAAEKAAWVYASEPVGTMREFMRDKIILEGIPNIRVLDGFITRLPFPDHTFDAVISGHVIGDDIDSETAEMERVCKPGGWLVDCVGDAEHAYFRRTEMTARGWEEIVYTGTFGYPVYNYRKQVNRR